MRYATTSKTLAIVLLVAACGSSSSDDASKFVGTWTFDSGTITATCSNGLPGGSFPIAGLSGMITKVDNTHIRLTANSSCIINFTVSGATATAPSGQSCTLPTPTLGPQEIAISSWTMTLTGTGAGATMSASISGTALAGLCTASGSGSLSQHSGTDGGADG